MKNIIPNWTCRTLCWRVTGQITKFLINPFQRHSLLFVWLLTTSVCVRRSGQNSLIILTAGKDCLFVSHRLSARHRHKGAGASLQPKTLPSAFLVVWVCWWLILLSWRLFYLYFSVLVVFCSASVDPVTYMLSCLILPHMALRLCALLFFPPTFFPQKISIHHLHSVVNFNHLGFSVCFHYSAKSTHLH